MSICVNMYLLVIIFCIPLGIIADNKMNKQLLKYTKINEQECQSTNFALCLKEIIGKYVEQFKTYSNLWKIVKVKKNNDYNPKNFNSTNSTANNIDKNFTVGNILSKALNFLASYTFEFKIPTNTISSLRSFVNEGRRRKKRKEEGFMSLMMLFHIKAIAIGAMTLKFIGLIATKALLIAKVALTISTVIALRKMLEHKPHSSTYEVIAYPHHEHEHGYYDRLI